MNYSFQLRGIPNANRLDYSRSDLPELIENDDSANPALLRACFRRAASSPA
jgi:hypothetical protein